MNLFERIPSSIKQEAAQHMLAAQKDPRLNKRMFVNFDADFQDWHISPFCWLRWTEDNQITAARIATDGTLSAEQEIAFYSRSRLCSSYQIGQD